MSVYQDLIDEMVIIARRNVKVDRIRSNRHAERTNTWSWRLSKHEKERKNLLKALTQEQRELVCELLEDARVSAVHDILAHLDWSSGHEEQPLQLGTKPFNAESQESPHGDFIARIEGDEWP